MAKKVVKKIAKKAVKKVTAKNKRSAVEKTVTNKVVKKATKKAAPKSQNLKKHIKTAQKIKVQKATVAVKKVQKSIAKKIKKTTTPKVDELPRIQKPVKKNKPDISKVRIPRTSTKVRIPYIPDTESSILIGENNIQVMNNNNIPNVRYSDADLEEFRQVIVAKIERSKAELHYLQELIKDKDIAQKAFVNADDGNTVQEYEQLVQMASRQIDFIKKLDEALIRIENKTYGICRITGKLIDKKRLLSVPHATLSIEAKTAQKNLKQ